MKMAVRSSRRIDFAALPASVRNVALDTKSRKAKPIIVAADLRFETHNLAAVKAAAKAKGALVVDRNGRVL